MTARTSASHAAIRSFYWAALSGLRFVEPHGPIQGSPAYVHAPHSALLARCRPVEAPKRHERPSLGV